MNQWLIAALVLLAVGLIPLTGVALLADMMSAAAALTLGGPIASLVLLLLSQGFGRQPFVDLAVVLAIVSFCGSLILARFLEWRV